MAETLKYDITFTGLERAAASLKDAAGRAAGLAGNLAAARQSGAAATAAANGIDAAPIDQAAQAAHKLAGNLAAAGDKAAISAARIKSISTMAAGMALDVAGSALAAHGLDRAADYLQSIGGGAVSGAAVGGMVGGAPGALIGGLVGGAAGGLKQFFGDQAAERQAAEALAKAVAQIGIEADQASRSLQRIETPAQLEREITRINDALANLSSRAAAGLIDPGQAAAATDALREQLALARQLLPLRQRSAAQQAAAALNIETAQAKRELERIKGPDQIKNEITRINDALTVLQERGRAGLIDKDTAAAQTASLREQLKLAEQLLPARQAAAQQDRDVKSARGLLSQTNAAAASRGDALSAKGWGGIGASVTSGMESLQRDANGLLRDISGSIRTMANRPATQPQAVYA